MVKKIVKKSNKITIENSGDDIILVGNKALLLAEACKLNKEKKAAEKRIAAIKVEMGLTIKGKYVNKAGDSLTLAVSDSYSEIDPEKLYNSFVKNRKKNKYWGVVKVQLGALEKVIPQASIEKMRTKLKPVARWTFK